MSPKSGWTLGYSSSLSNLHTNHPNCVESYKRLAIEITLHFWWPWPFFITNLTPKIAFIRTLYLLGNFTFEGPAKASKAQAWKARVSEWNENKIKLIKFSASAFAENFPTLLHSAGRSINKTLKKVKSTNALRNSRIGGGVKCNRKDKFYGERWCSSFGVQHGSWSYLPVIAWGQYFMHYVQV